MLDTFIEHDFEQHRDSSDNAAQAEMTPGHSKPVDKDSIVNLLRANSATKRKHDTREAQTSASKMRILTYKQHVQSTLEKSKAGDTGAEMDDVRPMGRKLMVTAVSNPEDEMFSWAPIQDLDLNVMWMCIHGVAAA